MASRRMRDRSCHSLSGKGPWNCDWISPSLHCGMPFCLLSTATDQAPVTSMTLAMPIENLILLFGVRNQTSGKNEYGVLCSLL